MRHRVSGKKLNRNQGHRNGLRRTMIAQFFTHERIRTTRAKAEFIRGDAERLITLARNSMEGEDIQKVNARRKAAAQLGGAPDIVKKLFDDIGPRYANRNGGYTRMFKLGPRQGDAADMVLLELVEE
ncbi:MAG: 50S ribosomal protein L17 [Anaerolineaceae bacterium]|nr:50S ribosomal protein L17 [Anaerolineaceae bacterium]